MPKKGWRSEEEKKARLPPAAWRVEIPASDPLNARLDEEHVTVSDKAVFALYQISNSKHHITAFGLADGKRLWDREISHGSSYTPVSLTVVGDLVGVTTWQNFATYSAADGSERYRLGAK